MSKDPGAVFLDIVIGLTLAFIVAAPLEALVIAWGASTIWSWFLVKAYGPGPTLSAWFGISCIATLLTLTVKRQTPKEGGVLMRVATVLSMTVIGVLLLLASAAVTHDVMGW